MNILSVLKITYTCSICDPPGEKSQVAHSTIERVADLVAHACHPIQILSAWCITLVLVASALLVYCNALFSTCHQVLLRLTLRPTCLVNL